MIPPVVLYGCETWPLILRERKWREDGEDCIMRCIVTYTLPCALTEHHAMKAYWGVEIQLHSFFDLGTRWR
jgi:hypothetical protein